MPDERKRTRFLEPFKRIREKFRSRTPSPQTSSTPQQPSTPQPLSISQPSDPHSLQSGYTQVAKLFSPPASPQTLTQQAKEGGETVYTALKDVAQGIYKCSDMFLPLKTGVGVFLEAAKRVNLVSMNRQELGELEVNLKAILSIVQKYQEHDAMDAIRHRIETFCRAVELQVEAVNDLRNHSVWKRTAEGTTDAGKIKKAFRNMSNLCAVFQMDTQLNIDKNVMKITKLLKDSKTSSILDRLRYEGTSYDTRLSSSGTPRECMPGTRVNILRVMEDWALGDGEKKVYWLVGMAGTGKINHPSYNVQNSRRKPDTWREFLLFSSFG